MEIYPGTVEGMTEGAIMDEGPVGGPFTMEALIWALREDRDAGQALPGNRFCLKALTFDGEEDVKQFLQEFRDVATVAEWPTPMSLL